MDEIDSEKSIFFSGSIRCKGAIKCAKDINAGEDYGIHAGLHMRMSEKSKYATITAKDEPHNIVCGTFVKND